MNDFEQFKALMRKAKSEVDVLVRRADGEWVLIEQSGVLLLHKTVVGLMGWRPSANVGIIVRVEHGSSSHFQAAFAVDGSIIEAGQFEDM